MQHKHVLSSQQPPTAERKRVRARDMRTCECVTEAVGFTDDEVMDSSVGVPPENTLPSDSS